MTQTGGGATTRGLDHAAQKVEWVGARVEGQLAPGNAKYAGPKNWRQFGQLVPAFREAECEEEGCGCPDVTTHRGRWAGMDLRHVALITPSGSRPPGNSIAGRSSD